MKIGYALVHLNRKKLLQKAVRHHSPHTDMTIVVDGNSNDGSVEWMNSEESKELNVHCLVHPWVDDPPGQRNKYLDYARQYKVDWLLSTDDDEYLEEPAIWKIRELVENAESKGITCLRFNAHDIQINEKGKIWDHCSSYWNPLMLFKLGPQVKYSGKTHVSLSSVAGKTENSGYKYYHIKSKMDEWFRGCRNRFTTAAPASNSTSDSNWLQFKNLCKFHELNYFQDLAKLMREGIVPQDLVEIFIKDKDSDNSEARSYFVSYFVHLHPELNPGLSNRDYTYDTNRQPFRGLMF